MRHLLLLHCHHNKSTNLNANLRPRPRYARRRTVMVHRWSIISIHMVLYAVDCILPEGVAHPLIGLSISRLS